LALSGTERHRDQGGDQAGDHETKTPGTKLALALLEAVSAGSMRSFELSAALVAAVLNDDLPQRAMELRTLLDSKSPFAMVRAVELAERILGAAGALGHHRSYK
jgi:hypothetical protein